MHKMLGILAAVGLLTFSAGSVLAQGVGVRIGVGAPGHDRGLHRGWRNHHRPVVVRPARSRVVCRTAIRERVGFGGLVVGRPTEVCRRVYVD